jgi:GNAT superfamily N-acetyltransferase
MSEPDDRSGFVIRPVEKDEVSQLVQLYTHLVPGIAPLELPDALAKFDEIKAQPLVEIFGGFQDDILVTSCMLIVTPSLLRGGRSFAYVENVVTHADHRRKGFGQSVVRHAVDRAFAVDCYRVMLITGGKRAGTLEFYASCGFNETKYGLEIRRL